MCFSVMSRNRVQLFMLVFMLFHCSDFEQKPQSSTALHVSFDVAHLLQTQRAETLTHRRHRDQHVNPGVLHRAPSNATSAWQAGHVTHSLDCRIYAQLRKCDHRPLHDQGKHNSSKDAHSNFRPSVALEQFLGQAILQTSCGLSFVCRSRFSFPRPCSEPTKLAACGVLPQHQYIVRSHVSEQAVFRGCCWLEHSSSPRSATQPPACGVLPRQRLRALLFTWRPHSGNLRTGGTSSSKQGPGLYSACGGVPRSWSSIGVCLDCSWPASSNDYKSEARRFLRHAAFWNPVELRCVCLSCPVLPPPCREPTGIEAGAVLKWSQCINRPHILGPAVHRGPGTQLTSSQVCRTLMSNGGVKSLRHRPKHSGGHREGLSITRPGSCQRMWWNTKGEAVSYCVPRLVFAASVVRLPVCTLLLYLWYSIMVASPARQCLRWTPGAHSLDQASTRYLQCDTTTAKALLVRPSFRPISQGAPVSLRA